jgi:hypothetical protein
MSASKNDVQGYGRNAKPAMPTQGAPAEAGANGKEQPIRVDGFAQVLAMLRMADPEFRESLLKRLAARDPQLARSLRADLGI